MRWVWLGAARRASCSPSPSPSLSSSSSSSLSLSSSFSSSSSSVGAVREGSSWASGSVSLEAAAVAVWGATTEVGKTLVSCGLARAACEAGTRVLYVKPLQTGADDGADDAGTVARVAATSGRGSVEARCLWAWGEAVGPHVAAARERKPVEGAEVVRATREALNGFGASLCVGQRRRGLALVETAGGPLSPGPDVGVVQADLYRALRLPGVLVGDARLGGVSGTLAAYEALRGRGMDVACVVMPEGDAALGGNWRAVEAYLRREPGARWGASPRVCVVPNWPAPEEALEAYFGAAETRAAFAAVAEEVEAAHAARAEGLRGLGDAAGRVLWWPFTQHARVGEVTRIDARAGEALAVFVDGDGESPPRVEEMYDGCASWWTQGVGGASEGGRLARTIGHAAARYGHVMFPENAHAPAVDAARLLLEGPGRGWASRVFYTDDGSTAVEVALKMAFRARFGAEGYPEEGLGPGPGPGPDGYGVVGVAGSYHGDTLGAMDASPATVFNGPRQTPWYRGRGVFLGPPTLALRRGAWRVVAADGVEDLGGFASRDAAFDWAARDASPLRERYRAEVQAALDGAEREDALALGALVVEPLLLGAGGMVLVDPLWQRTLVQVCRARGMPVIFDEVFCGLWRLGVEGTNRLLGVNPDVATYAKLLTGGTVPLAATLATEDVFRAFVGEAKTDALLHGHSYSAHAVGCAAAVHALSLYRDPASNPNLRGLGAERLDDVWDAARLEALSLMPGVDRVVALGSVVAFELAPEGRDGGAQGGAAQTGYAGGADAASRTSRVIRALRTQHAIYCRPLGNVVYLMVSPVTPKATCDTLLDKALAVLAATTP